MVLCVLSGLASCLVILAEEEMVFIDLKTEEWPSFASPYLTSLHSSAITCSCFVSNVASDVFNKIKVRSAIQYSTHA